MTSERILIVEEKEISTKGEKGVLSNLAYMIASNDKMEPK